MRIPRSIRNNLRFLIAEVSSQVANLEEYFSSFSNTLARRIVDRSGYASNLKMRIHESCLKRITGAAVSDTALLRALESVATDLDRLTELCRDSIQQLEQVQRKRSLHPAAYAPLLQRISKAVDRIEPAIRNSDTQLALKIGRVSPRLQRGCKRLLKQYTDDLKRKQHTEDLIAGLLVAHCIEQMGDTLLNISETIISANLGQYVNMDRYHSLQNSIDQLGGDLDVSGMVIEPVAETRSGSGISGISAPDANAGDFVAIFKDGKKRKLREERQGMQNWNEIFPGLAPRILSYHKRGQSAALLIEHLAGSTFEQILLHEPPQLLQETLQQLNRTLESVWRETQTQKPVTAHFTRQLSQRLDEVYSIHPEFRQGNSRICGQHVASFDTLLQRARKYEAGLEAPFAVYIHGDFNVDNIIYDPLEKKISFIDLHRSRYMDYVQDVSVFMVSSYRLQILDRPLRQRILGLTRDFYRFAAAFAERSGDRTFELRLALGLARSFATSTRFILDKSLARAMFLRARYLLEQVLATAPQQVEHYRVPVEEVFVG